MKSPRLYSAGLLGKLRYSWECAVLQLLFFWRPSRLVYLVGVHGHVQRDGLDPSGVHGYHALKATDTVITMIVTVNGEHTAHL